MNPNNKLIKLDRFIDNLMGLALSIGTMIVISMLVISVTIYS